MRSVTIADVEFVLGSRDGDVEEAAFFLDVAGLDGAAGGELAVGAADQKHDVVLKAFGLVDGRQLDGFLVGVDLLVVGLAYPVGGGV